MVETRVQRALSPDGTWIAGRVRGQGPRLVLIHGALEDGEFGWNGLLHELEDHFTCYLMNTRGRGLSAESTDYSRERRIEDVVAFVESIAEPVGLVAESGGALLALAAAAREPAVSAVAVYEPAAYEALSEEAAAGLESAVERLRSMAGEGKTEEAARAFTELVANEEELAALAQTGYFESAAQYVPLLLQELEHTASSDAPSPTASETLAAITAPVLVLQGGATARSDWLPAAATYVAEQVPDARLRTIEGAGHYAPLVSPEPVVEELVAFFDEVL